ncbi:MAG: tetratricopeptide repeat protein [Bacteroidota bacterium]
MHKLTTLSILLLLFLAACQDIDKEKPNVLRAGLNTSESAIQIPVLLQRGEAIYAGKEWENVQNQYSTLKQKALAGDQEAVLYLAQLFTLEARVTGEHGHYYPAALELIEQVLEKGINDPNVRFGFLLTKASVLLSQHEFEAALATALQAKSINSHNAQVYGALVDAYVELGEYEAAVAAADKMVAIRPDLRSYARVSYLREIYGQVDAAIEAMKLAVAAGYPGTEETAWTALELGHLYTRYGKTQAARQVYEQILMDRKDYPFAIAALAELEIEAQNYAAAEELLERATAIIPEVGFFEQLAHIYKATGRNKALVETLQEIEEMLQDDVDSGHNMNLEYAALYRDLVEDYELALRYASIEHQKRPNNIDTNQMLASIYHKQAKPEAVAKHLKIATQTNAKYPSLLAIKAEY